MTVLRQGDVLLVAIEDLPPHATPALPVRRGDRLVHALAVGEATGHAHTLCADERVEVFSAAAGDSGQTTGYLAVAGHRAVLEHEEHRDLPVPAGLYRIIQQREHDPARRRWARAND